MHKDWDTKRLDKEMDKIIINQAVTFVVNNGWTIGVRFWLKVPFKYAITFINTDQLFIYFENKKVFYFTTKTVVLYQLFNCINFLTYKN